MTLVLAVPVVVTIVQTPGAGAMPIGVVMQVHCGRVLLADTPAYAFTDYHAQAQTIEYCVVDMSKLPKDGS